MREASVQCWSKIFHQICNSVVHAIRRILEPTEMFTYSCCRHSRMFFAAMSLAVGLLCANNLEAGKNKKKAAIEQPEPPPLPEIDTRNLVWPDPPETARIRWL